MGRVPKNCTQVKVKVLVEIFTQVKVIIFIMEEIFTQVKESE